MFRCFFSKNYPCGFPTLVILQLLDILMPQMQPRPDDAELSGFVNIVGCVNGLWLPLFFWPGEPFVFFAVLSKIGVGDWLFCDQIERKALLAFTKTDFGQTQQHHEKAHWN